MERRVLVMRPEPGASETAARLAARSYAPVLLPLTRIVPLEARWPHGQQFDAVVVTSANGLRHLPPAMRAQVCDLPLYAVGERTAQEASGFGRIHVAQDAAHLLPLFATLPRGARVVYPCGRERQSVLEAGLAKAGIHVHPLEVYAADVIRRESGEAGTILGGAPFWSALLHSPRGAELFVAMAREMDQGLFRTAVLVAISQAAARMPRAAGYRVAVAERPDDAHMLARLDALLAQEAGRASSSRGL